MGKFCHDPLQKHETVYRNIKDLRTISKELLKKLLQHNRKLDLNTILCSSCRKTISNDPTLLPEIQNEETFETSSMSSISSYCTMPDVFSDSPLKSAKLETTLKNLDITPVKKSKFILLFNLTLLKS